jgi:hypothetical protein
MMNAYDSVFDCEFWMLGDYDSYGEFPMIEDVYEGSLTIVMDLRPKFTIWKKNTVSRYVTIHKRKARRSYKHYLATGDVRQFIKSQKLITRRDFD